MKNSIKSLAFALSVSLSAFACSPDQEAPGNEASSTLSAYQISQIQETTAEVEIQPIGGIEEVCNSWIRKGSQHFQLLTEMDPYAAQPGNQTEVVALLNINSGNSSGKLLLEKGNHRLIFEAEGQTAITNFSAADFSGMLMDNCSKIDKIKPQGSAGNASNISGNPNALSQSSNQETSILKQLFSKMEAAYTFDDKNHYAFMNLEFNRAGQLGGAETIFSQNSPDPLMVREYVIFGEGQEIKMITHDFFTGKAIELVAAQPMPGNVTFYASESEDVFPAVIDLSQNANGGISSKLSGMGPFGQVVNIQMKYEKIRK